MSNRRIGEVSFSALGQTFTLQFTTHALCEFEAEAGDVSALTEMFAPGGRQRVTRLRAAMRAGLCVHHPDIATAQAEAIIDDLGLPRAFGLVSDAVMLAFRGPDDTGGNGPLAAAPAAPDGSGTTLRH